MMVSNLARLPLTPDRANSSSFETNGRIYNVNKLFLWTEMAAASNVVKEEVKGHDGRSVSRRVS